MSEGSSVPGRRWRSAVPFERARIGAVAIYCSDGRWGEQFDDFVQNRLGLPRYDRLAVPGGAACLAGHRGAHGQEAAAIDQVRFLVEVHGLTRAVLIAHQQCAFYLRRLGVRDDDLRARQEEDLRRAARRIRELDPRLGAEAWLAVLDGQAVAFEPVEA